MSCCPSSLARQSERPRCALLLAAAPIAPEPFVPEVFTPSKLITVMDEMTLCDKVAVTDTELSVEVEKALQISAEPLCRFAR